MTANRLKWPKPVRWFLRMDAKGGLPKWWQWPIPGYKKYGGPGRSCGLWINEPALTDWGIPGDDAMDELFKWHDWAYQHGLDLDVADCGLVHALRCECPGTFYGKFYRLLAMAGFTAWPLARRLWRML